MKKIKTGDIVKPVLLAIIPVIYFKIYYMTWTYTQNRLNNFEYSNMLVPAFFCALVICFFTVLMLEIGRSYSNSSCIKRIIAVTVLALHLLIGAFITSTFTYYMYIEVVASLLIVIFAIAVEGVMNRIT